MMVKTYKRKSIADKFDKSDEDTKVDGSIGQKIHFANNLDLPKRVESEIDIKCNAYEDNINRLSSVVDDLINRLNTVTNDFEADELKGRGEVDKGVTKSPLGRKLDSLNDALLIQTDRLETLIANLCI